MARFVIGSVSSCFPATMPLCGVLTKSGTPCRWVAPCGIHTPAWLERQALSQTRATERAAREALPKCGEMCRSGERCKMPKPCSVHGAVAGMKQCSSTLDADPFDRCRAKCEIGSLFCESHVDFPDMGRRAGIYGDSCKRRRVDPTVAEFMAVAYPGASGNVAIHDIALYVEAQRVKMA
jgi:hypothetical protein